jgi:hypothetical protein
MNIVFFRGETVSNPMSPSPSVNEKVSVPRLTVLPRSTVSAKVNSLKVTVGSIGYSSSGLHDGIIADASNSRTIYVIRCLHMSEILGKDNEFLQKKRFPVMLNLFQHLEYRFVLM